MILGYKTGGKEFFSHGNKGRKPAHTIPEETKSLILDLYDATGTIAAEYFDSQETLKGYYNVLDQILNNYGIPYMFYTDKRTVFEYRQKKLSNLEDNTFTQFGYACRR